MSGEAIQTAARPSSSTVDACLTATSFIIRSKDEVRTRPRVTVTNADALLDAALEGMGVAVIPDFMADEPLSRRELTELLPEWTLPRIPVNALHDATRGASRVLREALSELKDAMA